jgi:EpsI family protein
VALILLGAWPMLAGIASGRGADPAPPIELPALVAGWTGGGDALTSWQPSFVGADQSASRTYRRDSAAVGVLAYVYSNQTQGAELINARNRLVVEKDPDWRMLSHGRGMTGVGLPIIETEIKTTRGDPEVLVWQTYWVGGRTTVDPIAIKLMDAINVLLGRARRAATVIYYTPATDDLDAARADLAAFAQAAGADVIAAVAAEKE